MILEPLQLAPRLQSLPDLGAHEIAAAQLATNPMDGAVSGYRSDHVGRVVGVRQDHCFVAGKLLSVSDSTIAPLLVLRIGQFTTAVHPTHPVIVAPDGYRLTITATPRAAETPEPTTTQGEHA